MEVNIHGSWGLHHGIQCKKTNKVVEFTWQTKLFQQLKFLWHTWMIYTNCLDRRCFYSSPKWKNVRHLPKTRKEFLKQSSNIAKPTKQRNQKCRCQKTHQLGMKSWGYFLSSKDWATPLPESQAKTKKQAKQSITFLKLSCFFTTNFFGGHLFWVGVACLCGENCLYLLFCCSSFKRPENQRTSPSSNHHFGGANR